MADENAGYILATTTPSHDLSIMVTKNPILQAIIEKIESGDIDPRDVDWNALLDAANIPASSPDSTSVTESEILSGFNLGLLIPLVIVSFFMVVLLLCTIRHSWSSRCTQAIPKKKHSFSSLSRTQGESVRSSTRSRQLQPEDRSHDGSEHGQRSMLLPPVITKVGKLGSIRESPEDRYKDKATISQGEVNYTPGSGKSIRSGFSNVLTDFPYILSNIGAYPVPVHSDCSQGCAAKPHPNLGNGPPYISPYVTWITPGMSQSDPMLSTNGLTELETKLRKGFACKLVQQQNSNTPQDGKPISKSPYHPNYNTPTNGSDNDERMPSNAVINDSSSLMAPAGNPGIPVQVRPEILALKGMPNLPTLLLHRQSIPSCDTSTPGVCSGSKASSFDGTCLSAQLSCPSSMGSWHYNDLYNQPAQGVPPMKNLLTQALLNSAARPLNGEILDPNHFLNDNNQINLTPCQPSIVSMFPNVGSSNNSFQNNPQHNRTACSGSPSGEQLVLPIQSTNTSLCGHMDSCETSDNYSSMVTTGANSDQVSGYIAGPSHSTSIEKNSTLSNNYTNQSSINSESTTSNDTTSSSAQALSAIQNATVNSEISAGQQIFHQALSLDGTNASVTLSFASTAKSAPAALHCNFHPQRFLHMMPTAECSSDTPQLYSMGRSTGVSSGLSNQVYSTGSGSTTPTCVTQLERPISNLSSNPSVSYRSTNPFLQPEPVKIQGNGKTTPSGSSGTYEWDFYPFSGEDIAKSGGSTTPEVTRQSAVATQESMVTTVSTNPSATSSQNRRRSNQPLLSDAQYWV